ncbi:MAG: ABC transporter permease [Candidatus Diapherotrites archaeon]|nr:ABC transporter permease [Candidatus Diapherotrites archaeon]
MFNVAARNLWQKKTRSGLAVSGLIIGVVAIILLVSMTAGLKAYVEDIASQMNGIMIMEKDSVDQTLSYLDEDYGREMERVEGVRAAIPEIWGIVSEIEGESPKPEATYYGFAYLLGIDPAKEMLREGGFFGVDVAKGRGITTVDKKAAIIGQVIADAYKKSLGSTIEVEGEKLKVVGILGESDLMGSAIITTMDVVRDASDFPAGKVSDFMVMVRPGQDENQVAKHIEFQIEDVDAYTASETLDEFSEMTATIDLFFYVVSVIAILIGGVGIINTMLMSVMERMKEFGVLRSMGWTSDDVLRLVITESVLLGVSGGIIGCVGGLSLISAINLVMPFPLVASNELLIAALIFSLILGVFGGTYPAWKASKLDPIQAMRGGE